MSYTLPPLDFNGPRNPPGPPVNGSPLSPFEPSTPGTQHPFTASLSVESLSLSDLMKNQHVLALHNALTQNSQLVSSLWQENCELRSEVERLQVGGIGSQHGIDFNKTSYVFLFSLFLDF